MSRMGGLRTQHAGHVLVVRDRPRRAGRAAAAGRLLVARRTCWSRPRTPPRAAGRRRSGWPGWSGWPRCSASRSPPGTRPACCCAPSSAVPRVGPDGPDWAVGFDDAAYARPVAPHDPPGLMRWPSCCWRSRRRCSAWPRSLPALPRRAGARAAAPRRGDRAAAGAARGWARAPRGGSGGRCPGADPARGAGPRCGRSSPTASTSTPCRTAWWYARCARSPALVTRRRRAGGRRGRRGHRRRPRPGSATLLAAAHRAALPRAAVAVFTGALLLGAVAAIYGAAS